MDFQQAENKFKQLRAQFKAGELIEAEFKALLEALMVQDEEGSWWMIGFETEMWYRNDGEEWVRADPPRTSSKQTKPAVSDEFVGMESERMDNVDQKISEKVTNKKEEPEATEKAKLDTTENATREKIEREGAKKAKQEQKEKAEPERKSVPVLHFKNLNDKTHEETSGQASKVTKSIASKPDRRPAWWGDSVFSDRGWDEG